MANPKRTKISTGKSTKTEKMEFITIRDIKGWSRIHVHTIPKMENQYFGTPIADVLGCYSFDQICEILHWYKREFKVSWGLARQLKELLTYDLNPAGYFTHGLIDDLAKMLPLTIIVDRRKDQITPPAWKLFEQEFLRDHMISWIRHNPAPPYEEPSQNAAQVVENNTTEEPEEAPEMALPNNVERVETFV